MNGEVGKRVWKIVLEETDKYKYLGVVAIGGINVFFRSLGERMKDARGVIGMVKYAAKRSGSRFVEGWKSLVVNKLMYGAGAMSWCEKECEELEIFQREMGRWLWGCKMYVKNELVHGKTRWSSYNL